MKTLAFLVGISLILSCKTSTTKIPAPTELRGVWLTNVDSEVLRSRAQIVEAMQFLQDNNFNVVFPVVWNKGLTLYRSAIMDSMFGMPIDTLYGERDPLAELIEEAHKRNIAVIPWFEFGFAAEYEEHGQHILKQNPHWAAKDVDRKLLIKNNFVWMNAFHPEVQNFLLTLVKEVVSGYDVEGIQGDDRLPALPSGGGYSDYTVSLYKKEHNGQMPPHDFMDKKWLHWRANRLDQFCGRLYKTVKEMKPAIQVSWAPSIYKWCYDEYLQDWPQWMKSGWVDLLHPQMYRYDFTAYKEVLDEQLRLFSENNLNKAVMFPGILVNVGDYKIEAKKLLHAIRYNREQGIKGEVFFFYEGLRKNDDLLARELKNTVYKNRAELPAILQDQLDGM